MTSESGSRTRQVDGWHVKSHSFDEVSSLQKPEYPSAKEAKV